jgi:type I restriction enzyme S subunit
LKYLFVAEGEDLLRFASGSVHQTIYFPEAKAFHVCVPPPPEQRRIVGILDEAFEGMAAAKANTEKNLQNAHALFESHLQSVFTQGGEGWLHKPLGELASFRNGINFTKSSRGESVKIVGVKNFQQNFWAPLDGLDAVTTEGALPDSDLLKENDVLFVRSNGNMELIGRSVLVGQIAEKITHSGFTIRARLTADVVDARYLCHFLKSNHARRKMIEGGIGTNIKSLNQTTLAKLVVPLPSTAQQARIAAQLEAIDADTQRLGALYERKLDALDALKKSMLHQAFTGQLGVHTA